MSTKRPKFQWVFSVRIKLGLSKLGIEPILEKDNATQPGFKCWLYEATPEFLKAFPQIANEGVD